MNRRNFACSAAASLLVVSCGTTSTITAVDVQVKLPAHFKVFNVYTRVGVKFSVSVIAVNMKNDQITVINQFAGTMWAADVVTAIASGTMSVVIAAGLAKVLRDAGYDLVEGVEGAVDEINDGQVVVSDSDLPDLPGLGL